MGGGLSAHRRKKKQREREAEKLDFQRRLSSEKLSVEKKGRAVEEISDDEPVGSPCQKRAFLGMFVENSLLSVIITLFYNWFRVLICA